MNNSEANLRELMCQRNKLERQLIKAKQQLKSVKTEIDKEVARHAEKQMGYVFK